MVPSQLVNRLLTNFLNRYVLTNPSVYDMPEKVWVLKGWSDAYHWNANALLGGLLFLKEKETDPTQMSTWTHKGGVVLSEGSSKTSEGK